MKISYHRKKSPALRKSASAFCRDQAPGAAGPPSCVSHVAIGGSQLVFSGNPGKLVNGTGIYQGATGRTISSKEVPGMDDASDVVLRIQLAA